MVQIETSRLDNLLRVWELFQRKKIK